MCYLSKLTIYSSSQTKWKCGDHNELSEKQTEKQTKNVNSIETTTNQAENTS